MWAVDLPLIVVGSVYNWGTASSHSQGGPLVSLYAQGYGVKVDRMVGLGSEVEGTSIAAAAISGLAAYVLSLNQFQDRLKEGSNSPTNVKALLMELAYDRSGDSNGPKVAFNGQYWADTRNCVRYLDPDAQGLDKQDIDNTTPCSEWVPVLSTLWF